jgi:acetolactate synthase-1/2/3 large subunit
VFLNGLARGCVPADHELFFSRARSDGLKGADVALVIGVPMDFRLAFGGAFGDETQLVVHRPRRGRPPASAPVAADLVGSIGGILDALRREARGSRAPGPGSSTCAAAETEKRAAEREQLEDPRSPLHPMRLYKELGEVLDRDAIVIGDGGDFVSYAAA